MSSAGNNTAPGAAEIDRHLRLHRAAKLGDWQTAKDLIDLDGSIVTARITISNDTVLHTAAAEGHSKFVKELVMLMTPEQLELANFEGETALQGAVIAGNTESVKAMVEKNPKLTHIPDRYGFIPLVNAANYISLKEQKKDMIKCLYNVMSNNHVDPSPFSGNLGRQIIHSVIGAGFYDIGKDIIQAYPNLAIERESTARRGPCALEMMAASDAFLSRNQLTFWDRFVYSLHFPSTPGIIFHGDAENPPEGSSFHVSARVCRWVSGIIRKLAKQLVPGITVHNKKLMHEQAVELTKLIIKKITSTMNSSEIEEYFRETAVLDTATKLGAVELVTECLRTIPDLYWVKMGKSDRDIFYSAVGARQAEIFSLLYDIPGFKKKLAASRDKDGHTILHMAAWSQNSSPLAGSVYCVALRVQQELQWFKEVESLVPPTHGIVIGSSGVRTPLEIFKKEHKALFGEAEKWIKDTAQSCAFVSALIATVVFAATFTVPGGYYGGDDKENKGNPIFLHKNAFVVFAVANALALFSSTSSLLMFLALLTSQYGYEDFLEPLPRKLMLGLLTLFISIITMMVAFCATLYMVLGPRFPWLPILLSVVSGVPVCLFLWSHLSLFVKMFLCTYGPSMFRRRI
ncbi:hypothetical protein MKX03_013463 [Papaver bracteatum]|nr:hypothetical protein MKX03_013463 [Papaver bracteatum]